MHRDQYLPAAAAAMITAAQRHESPAAVLRKRCPHVYRQMTSDAHRAAMFSLWGRSVNFDEHAGQTIVDPAIVEVVGELAGKSMRGEVVHAGLLHTYGYLFSVIDTPYGAKTRSLGSTLHRRGLRHRPLAAERRASTRNVAGQRDVVLCEHRATWSPCPPIVGEESAARRARIEAL
ncbi:MAG: hypothetical protein QM775_27505 [Pirellulales bacterium]